MHFILCIQISVLSVFPAAQLVLDCISRLGGATRSQLIDKQRCRNASFNSHTQGGGSNPID